jgi:hypothetical protein
MKRGRFTEEQIITVLRERARLERRRATWRASTASPK